MPTAATTVIPPSASYPNLEENNNNTREEENNRRASSSATAAQPIPQQHQLPKPPLSSSYNSAAIAGSALLRRPASANRSSPRHAPLERRSNSVLTARSNNNQNAVASPLERYLPPLQIVYGTQSVAGSDDTSSNGRVMSEKVQMLAASIYKELERMIKKHGEDSVKELMPLVVNVLESLDLAYMDKEEHAVELEMLKEENEQLLNQYEREKQMRKSNEQKYLEQEEILTEHSRILEEKLEGVESKLRTTELRLHNANHHIQRFEETEAEQKAEFEKLHERYNELLRTHIDHVERSKYLLGADKFDMMQSLPAGHNRGGMAVSVDRNVRGMSDIISAAHMSQSVNVDLANHISAERDYHEEFGQDNTEDLLASGRKDGNAIAEELEQNLKEDAAEEHQQEAGRAAPEQETEDDLGTQLTGMGREVENLIRENNELLETKNALNIVKNDLIAQVDQLSNENDVFREELRTLEMVKIKQAEKIRELENELKAIKEKIAAEEQEEQDIPMAQRKRFTRVEMARVLMERNQFKEKLMELQEALKYTEMQRAKKMTTPQTQSKSRIWDFFSGLFGETQPAQHSTPKRQPRRSISTTRKQNLARTFDLDTESMAEKRMAERRQQYKNVSQHMKKEDETRTRAYGWSIPSTIDTSATTSIPVPVCCRPLLDQQPSLKIWCATGILLHGGLNLAGEYIIGDDVTFYADPLKAISEKMELPMNSKLLEERFIWESSSLVWVASSNEKRSYVTIFDANNPNCIIECFGVCTSHLLCISSVAGVRESDYSLDESREQEHVREGGYQTNLPADIGANEAFGQVSWVKLRSSDVDSVPTFCSEDEKASPKRSRDFSVSESPTDNSTDQQSDADESKRNLHAYANLPPHIRDALSKYDNQQEMGTALPTVWMGLENDFIVVHSAVLNWRECLLRIKMPDAVLQILHIRGRIFAALANGSIAVFHRAKNGRWSTSGYHIIRLGQANSSVCNLTIVHDKVWVAYRNCVAVLNPDSLVIEDSFVAHPRKDSQVRHMVWSGNGVWLSIRLDSTIRLYHSRTMQHLQDVDIEPYLNTMLGNAKMDFLHLRITSLSIVNRKLWIGTGTGIIIAIPLSNEQIEKVDVTNPPADSSSSQGEPPAKTPGSLVRVYSSNTSADGEKGKSDGAGNANKFIPYCNLSLAQFSFHGHKDSVRFFVSVPADGVTSMTATMETRKLLMISGGDGYIDFRLGEEDPSGGGGSQEGGQKSQVRAHDLSNIIEWEIDCPNPYKADAPTAT